MSRKAAVATADDDPQYAPGPIRAGTDLVHSALSAFTARHPEYERLGPDAVLQALSTYRTDEEAEEQEKLRGEGIPLDWRPGDEDDEPLGRF